MSLHQVLRLLGGIGERTTAPASMPLRSSPMRPVDECRASGSSAQHQVGDVERLAALNRALSAHVRRRVRSGFDLHELVADEPVGLDRRDRVDADRADADPREPAASPGNGPRDPPAPECLDLTGVHARDTDLGAVLERRELRELRMDASKVSVNSMRRSPMRNRPTANSSTPPIDESADGGRSRLFAIAHPACCDVMNARTSSVAASIELRGGAAHDDRGLRAASRARRRAAARSECCA